MKTMQIEAGKFDNNELLRAAGVKRIFIGWYTVWYNGVALDSSTVTTARRNRLGKIKQ